MMEGERSMKTMGPPPHVSDDQRALGSAYQLAGQLIGKIEWAHLTPLLDILSGDLRRVDDDFPDTPVTLGPGAAEGSYLPNFKPAKSVYQKQKHRDVVYLVRMSEGLMTECVVIGSVQSDDPFALNIVKATKP